jgi:hypothetical protein
MNKYPMFSMSFLGSRTANSVRRQAQRELEREKALNDECQRAIDLKEHYFSNRQVHKSLFHSLFYILNYRSILKVQLLLIILNYYLNVLIYLVMKFVYLMTNYNNELKSHYNLIVILNQ